MYSILEHRFLHFQKAFMLFTEIPFRDEQSLSRRSRNDRSCKGISASYVGSQCFSPYVESFLDGSIPYLAFRADPYTSFTAITGTLRYSLLHRDDVVELRSRNSGKCNHDRKNPAESHTRGYAVRLDIIEWSISGKESQKRSKLSPPLYLTSS